MRGMPGPVTTVTRKNKEIGSRRGRRQSRRIEACYEQIVPLSSNVSFVVVELKEKVLFPLIYSTCSR